MASHCVTTDRFSLFSRFSNFFFSVLSNELVHPTTPELRDPDVMAKCASLPTSVTVAVTLQLPILLFPCDDGLGKLMSQVNCKS